MNGVALPLLILTNLAIAGFSGSILLTPAPQVASVVGLRPPSAPVPIAAVGRTVDQSQDATIGNVMFGISGGSEIAKADKPTLSPVQPSTGDIVLLGVLMVQEGADRQSVTVLMRHGRPPVVSRQKIGDVIEGWSIASAARNTVQISRPNGMTRFLKMDRSTSTRKGDFDQN